MKKYPKKSTTKNPTFKKYNSHTNNGHENPTVTRLPAVLEFFDLGNSILEGFCWILT